MDLQQLRKLISQHLAGEDKDAAVLEQWLDHMAGQQPFPGEMPAGRQKEQLRKAMLLELRQRTGQPNGRVTFMTIRRMAAAAAVALFLTGAAYWWFTKPAGRVNYIALHTNIGERKQIRLPDNSTIWLGPDATIEYAENFTSDRSLRLQQGEAFFDVYKDDAHPFRIAVDSLQVDVLGTSFNIQAYEQHSAVTIGVSTGKVRISKGSQVMGVLTEHQQMQVQKNNYTCQMTTGTQDVEGLKNNRINFENMPLAEVLTVLEHYYPVRFTLEAPLELRISGSFNTKLKIEQVVHVLQDLVANKVAIIQQQPDIYLVRSSRN
ncbi:FecR family protein [Chitinophaga sp. Cy-1792]|uniref:FecR family protein n=1 Tax=Chitinophaga sp. Cy-1792 TaxID=2608339 RepID=UPI0014234A54|nr:FecR domain-containing protein [Chitinophaga sp. Cy-1792]NIG54113.1 DUF4974 domain-containing protein [Chitinophaga sp. Cy-1792]